MSKRVILAVVFVLLGVAAAVPWLVGQRLRDGHEQWLVALSGSGIQVAERRYRPGWLSSEAEAVLVLPANGTGGPRLRVDTRLKHWDPGADARLSSARTLLAFVGNNPFIALESAISRDGVIQSRLSLAADQRPAGRVRFQPDDRELQGEIALEALSLPSAGGNPYRLQHLRMASRSRLGAAGLRLGDFEIQLATLARAARGAQDRELVHGLYIKSAATAEQGRVTVTSRCQVESLRLGGLAIQRLDALLHLDGMSAVLLARALRVLPLFFLEQPPPGGPQLALAGALASSFARLLQSEPSLSLERLRFATAEGDLDAALSWRLTPPEPRQALDPNHWLQRVQLEGRLTVAEALARRLTAALGDAARETGWVDEGLRQGLLQRRGDLLLAQWRLRDGWLKVNDRILQLTL